MAEGCPERFELEFFKYVWKFQQTKEQGLFESLRDFKGNIIILRSKKETKTYLEELKYTETV